MSEDATIRDSGLLTPKKIAIQLVGFAVGVGLLIWCIVRAIGDDHSGWENLFDADPLLIVGMLACSLGSAIINGSTFHVTIQPVRKVRWLDMQRINLVGNMLNYAPVRLGMIARIVYHVRVDRLGLLQVFGWFAFIGYFLALGVGACMTSTFATRDINMLWLALVLGQMAIGALVLKVFVGNVLLEKYGRGVGKMIAYQPGVWGAAGLRLLDLAMYVGRMAIAMHILKIDLPMASAVILAVVALAAGLIPFGRLGFREFCVAAAAGWIGTQEEAIDANMNALALVESAGEALVFIPGGALFLLWYRKKLMQNREHGGGESANAED